MSKLTEWQISGLYNEACAAEGHCPFYFGRDKEGGCHYFMALRILDGRANGVDLGGIAVVYVGLIAYTKYEDLLTHGEQVCIHISDQATKAQRDVLEPIARSGMGVLKFEKVLGVECVPIAVHDEGGRVSFKIPNGEMTQVATCGADGAPVQLVNQLVPSISDVEVCHSPAWQFRGFGLDFNETNTCSTRARFSFGGAGSMR